VVPPLESLERLGETFALNSPAAERKRMLVIVNPYATTVSDRLKNLVVYALQGRYEVEALDTQGRDHATELCREAAHEGYDVVVAFGGDGTVNEAANGLAGSATPLTTLPGGATNVYCKMLGIPGDIVDATEHMLRMADDWQPRKVDLAKVNDRYFTFSAGLGLDASVVERVDRHPRLKTRLGAYYYTYAAITTFTSKYIARPPKIELELPGGEKLEGVTALVQNGAQYTYFNDRPILMAEGADLTSGTLSGVVLEHTFPTIMPGIMWRALSQKARIVRHNAISSFEDATTLTARSRDDRAVHLQVDGDYIGEITEARFSIVPEGLSVVS
jgi:diacylglycerol kinase family enzyme